MDLSSRDECHIEMTPIIEGRDEPLLARTAPSGAIPSLPDGARQAGLPARPQMASGAASPSEVEPSCADELPPPGLRLRGRQCLTVRETRHLPPLPWVPTGDPTAPPVCSSPCIVGVEGSGCAPSQHLHLEPRVTSVQARTVTRDVDGWTTNTGAFLAHASLSYGPAIGADSPPSHATEMPPPSPLLSSPPPPKPSFIEPPDSRERWRARPETARHVASAPPPRGPPWARSCAGYIALRQSYISRGFMGRCAVMSLGSREKDAALPIRGVLGGSRLEMLGGLGWSIDGCLPRGR